MLTPPLDGDATGVASDCNGSCFLRHHTIDDDNPTSLLEAGASDTDLLKTATKERSYLGKTSSADIAVGCATDDEEPKEKHVN